MKRLLGCLSVGVSMFTTLSVATGFYLGSMPDCERYLGGLASASLTVLLWDEIFRKGRQ